MSRSLQRQQRPWLRSVDEGLPRARRRTRPVTPLEAVAVTVVVAAVLAMAVWFLFFSGGGIGPGTV
jgi:type VI protein secretion system component VasF